MLSLTSSKSITPSTYRIFINFYKLSIFIFFRDDGKVWLQKELIDLMAVGTPAFQRRQKQRADEEKREEEFFESRKGSNLLFYSIVKTKIQQNQRMKRPMLGKKLATENTIFKIFRRGSRPKFSEKTTFDFINFSAYLFDDDVGSSCYYV